MSATLDRRRANGLRPSIYGCATRRHDASNCSNKFISDISLGPFIFNYIANLIRAKDNVTSRTPLQVLERKLLSGEAFEGMGIDIDCLMSIREMLLNKETGIEYRPASVFENTGSEKNERQFLEDKKSKCEKALNRLKAVYLYGDEDYPEKDFIIERKAILDELNEIDERLATLKDSDDSEGEYGDEFFAKASYFVMVEKLLGDKYIEYEKYIRTIEPGIARNFIRTVISSISVYDGRVQSITFKNGMVHKFITKNNRVQ